MVYETVRQVPRGKVTTYAAVAKHLGVPRGARAVGWAMRACKDSNVPCHRVVGSDGHISGDAEGSRAANLIVEGVNVSESKVDLSKIYFEDFLFHRSKN